MQGHRQSHARGRAGRRSSGSLAATCLDPVTGQPIIDLLTWIGGEHYPYCPDYIEEVKRSGTSRRLNPNLDLTQLTRSSRMILAHPLALNTLWQEQMLPEACAKHIPRHDAAGLARLDLDPTQEPQARAGPCLFKTWELIPLEAATTVLAMAGERPLCLRKIASTIYQYRPSGEAAGGLRSGLFAALPITGVALIRYEDGSVHEKARAKLLAGLERNGEMALPFYETDK